MYTRGADEALSLDGAAVNRVDMQTGEQRFGSPAHIRGVIGARSTSPDR